jgi:DNA-binding transcriptional MerR regulator
MYRIADVAERSGFTATTLRYYEQNGLLPPSMRTAAGYRTSGERAGRRPDRTDASMSVTRRRPTI